MAGQASTLGQGSIAALGLTLALTGSAITSGSGTVVASERGIQAALSAGSVTQSASVTLTGSAITSGAGTVVGSSGQQTLVGQAITSAQGITGPVGNDVTAHLSGSEADFSTGVVESGGQLLQHQATTVDLGATSPGLTMALVGSESLSEAGTVVPSQDAEDTAITSHQGSATGSHDVPLVGESAAVSAGTITATGDAFAALTGQSATASIGDVGFDEQFALTGSSIASAQENVGAPGGVTLAGSSVSVVAGSVFLDNDRTFPLTGESFTAQDGACFASPLAFATGEVLSLSQGFLGDQTRELSGASTTVEAGILTAVVDQPEADAGEVSGGWPIPRKRPKKKPTLTADATTTKKKRKKKREEEDLLLM